MCNLRLNVSTQPASTIVCYSWFQLLITRSEKKWRRTSLFVQCLDNFSECPLVLSWFVNWNSDSTDSVNKPRGKLYLYIFSGLLSTVFALVFCGLHLLLAFAVSFYLLLFLSVVNLLTTVIERVGVDLLSKFTVLSPSTILTSLLSTAEPS